MIGNEVDNHFHSVLMNTLDQLLKVRHCAQIGVNGAVIRDSVWRAGAALGNVGMRGRRFGSVFQNAGQPNVCDTQIPNRVEGGFVNVVEGTAAVFNLAAVHSERGLLVSEKSREKLIDIHTAKLEKFHSNSSLIEKCTTFAQL